MVKLRRFLLSVSLILLVLLAFTIKPTSAKIGSGQLYVYMDSDYSTLVPQDDKGFYEVLPDQTVYIQISNITEFDAGEKIMVKIGFEVDGKDYTYVITDLVVQEELQSGVEEAKGLPGVGDPSAGQIISWRVGDYHDEDGNLQHIDIPACETITVHYKDNSGTGPEYITYDATPPCKVAHLHVTPEGPLGTLGMISVILASFAFYYIMKSRKTIPVLKY